MFAFWPALLLLLLSLSPLLAVAQQRTRYGNRRQRGPAAL
jgi:hypothetical protein